MLNNAEIAVMGPEGAVEIISEKMQKNLNHKAKSGRISRTNLPLLLRAASRGFIDEVIPPAKYPS